MKRAGRLVDPVRRTFILSRVESDLLDKWAAHYDVAASAVIRDLLSSAGDPGAPRDEDVVEVTGQVDTTVATPPPLPSYDEQVDRVINRMLSEQVRR